MTRGAGREHVIIDEIGGGAGVTDPVEGHHTGLVDLRYAMDKFNQMPLYTEIANPEKRDEFGAMIPSDAPKQIVWNSISASQPLVIDTAGYQSIAIHKSTAGIITPTTSNDGQTWFAVMGATVTAPQTMTATLPAATGIYIFPVTGRFFRLVGPASAVQCTIYLRCTPMVPLGTIGAVTTVSTVTTLTQFGGTNIVTAGLAGMLAVGGNVATGIAPTANPVQIGGVDAGRLYTPGMVAANLTPKTRRALVDEQGRFILANVDLQLNGTQNIQGTATANVRDVDQVEGQTILEVMLQVLIELKIITHQLREMAVGGVADDVNMLRNSYMNYNA